MVDNSHIIEPERNKKIRPATLTSYRPDGKKESQGLWFLGCLWLLLVAPEDIVDHILYVLVDLYEIGV